MSQFEQPSSILGHCGRCEGKWTWPAEGTKFPTVDQGGKDQVNLVEAESSATWIALGSAGKMCLCTKSFTLTPHRNLMWLGRRCFAVLIIESIWPYASSCSVTQLLNPI